MTTKVFNTGLKMKGAFYLDVPTRTINDRHYTDRGFMHKLKQMWPRFFANSRVTLDGDALLVEPK